MSHASEFAGFVAAIDHQHVIFDNECAVFFEDMEGFAIIADNETDDAVVHGVAGRDGVNVNFGFGESVGEAREHARAVIQEEG